VVLSLNSKNNFLAQLPNVALEYFFNNLARKPMSVQKNMARLCHALPGQAVAPNIRTA
jgi:hypothetical protein